MVPVAATDFDAEIKQLQATLHTVEQVLDLPAMKNEIADLETQVAAPDLWDDQANAQKVTGRLSLLQGEVERFEQLDPTGPEFKDAFADWAVALVAHAEAEERDELGARLDELDETETTMVLRLLDQVDAIAGSEAMEERVASRSGFAGRVAGWISSCAWRRSGFCRRIFGPEESHDGGRRVSFAGIPNGVHRTRGILNNYYSNDACLTCAINKETIR